MHYIPAWEENPAIHSPKLQQNRFPHEILLTKHFFRSERPWYHASHYMTLVGGGNTSTLKRSAILQYHHLYEKENCVLQFSAMLMPKATKKRGFERTTRGVEQR
jgi:hypothetical protein